MTQTTVSRATRADKKDVQPVTVRDASFDDYSQIASLLCRYELEAKPYEEWGHLWLGNPLYRSRSKRWPIGWVLEAQNKKIVGYLGNIPQAYQCQGKPLVAAVTHGWAVESFYRSYSILLVDQYFSQSDVDVFLSTTVNSQASNAFTTFDSRRVPAGRWDKSLFWITNARGFATSWASMKGIALAKPLGYALSVPLFIKTRFSPTVLMSKHNACDIEFNDRFDDRFDKFWHTLKERNSDSFLAVRSREELDWHYRYSILHKKLWILTTTNGPDLKSYALFYRQDNPKYGLNRIRLVDFQEVDGSVSLLPMISWALKRCRAEGIHMLEYVGISPELENAAKSLAPRQRRLPCWSYYYKSNNATLSRHLADPTVWKPSGYDGDSSL